jgi:RNA polymerase sigma-70 factor (ECF subfamily)
MTTAQDLPLPPHPAAAPPTPQPDRPTLALVPAPLPAAGEAIVDFDDALRAAFPRLHRYAARRLQDQHEAEEVVQEAMLRAFTHRETLRTEDDLMAWLTVVTGRLVIDRLRVRGRMTPVAELPAGSRSVRDTADVVVARDEARMALDVLEAMPARQASVLWSREVEGLSYDELSDRYGLSEPTVRSLLHRARKTLRREYAVRGGTVPSLGLVAFAPWLRGLRIAGRLRDAARKTTGAAAVTATGLAVATIAPLWSHPAPASPHVAAIPTVIVKTATHSAADVPRHAAPRPGARTPTHVASVAEPRIKTPLRTLPVTCGGVVSAGCDAPSTPMLFVKVPGNSDIGVSTGLVPVDCTSLPATAVTHCQPSDRKN